MAWGMVMKTLDTSNLPADQLKQLEYFAESADPELRDLLLGLSRCVRDGDEIIAVGVSSSLTPSQVAERLGMSRTHLYKLLDRGEIASYRVGRDRRIRFCDVKEFEERRQRDRRELAERFARQNQTAAAASDELADLL